MKILIIEDEKELAEAITSYLKKEGYLCEIAFDFNIAIEKMCSYNYDCLIIDITLPGGNGLNLIQKIQQKKDQTGIIIISAKNSLDDKIIGLEIGADDYLTKPFNLSELNARLKSLLRRKKFAGMNEIKINEISITPEIRLIKVNEEKLELTKKEYDLLMYFVTNQNRVLTKDGIAEHLWDLWDLDKLLRDYFYLIPV